MLDICAELGLLPREYYDLTISEIENAYWGYQIRQAKEWERARFMAWMGSLPYRDSKKPYTQYDVMELMTDPTEEELKEVAVQKQLEYDMQVEKMYEYYKSLGYNV